MARTSPRLRVRGQAECVLALLSEYDLIETATEVVLDDRCFSPAVMRAFCDRASELGVNVDVWPELRPVTPILPSWRR
jgi:hypothetical protein